MFSASSPCSSPTSLDIHVCSHCSACAAFLGLPLAERNPLLQKMDRRNGKRRAKKADALGHRSEFRSELGLLRPSLKRHSQNSAAVGSTAISRIHSMREILLAYLCILLSESVCLFPGIVLR